MLIKLTKPSDRTFIINNNFNRLLKEEAEYDRLRAEKEDKLKQE